MFASPVYDQAPGTANHNSGRHLNQRQLAFETLLKHVSMSTVAIVMLLAVAVLGLGHDKKPPKQLNPAITISASSFQNQEVGNKCSPDW